MSIANGTAPSTRLRSDAKVPGPARATRLRAAPVRRRQVAFALPRPQGRLPEPVHHRREQRDRPAQLQPRRRVGQVHRRGDRGRAGDGAQRPLRPDDRPEALGDQDEESRVGTPTCRPRDGRPTSSRPRSAGSGPTTTATARSTRIVYRFNMPDGKKDFRPVSLDPDTGRWFLKDPPQWLALPHPRGHRRRPRGLLPRGREMRRPGRKTRPPLGHDRARLQEPPEDGPRRPGGQERS